jgi:beta-aspartyl-dipeptidase (metallo-type)
MSVIFITGGEVYTPAYSGARNLLVVYDRLVSLSTVTRTGLDQFFPGGYKTLDATGCIVVPGFIDPHTHLDGGSGESGFGSRTPPLSIAEIATAGITTVVGVIGTDVTTKTMASLLARARGLHELGLSTYLFTGGYTVPPATLTGSVRQDMLLVPEILGAGETAISDHRSSAPSTAELARLVLDAHVGGILTGKCGVTHFHVGEAPSMLDPIKALLDDTGYAIQPAWLYPTHVERSRALVEEAARLSQRGCTVDMDTVEEDFFAWLPVYLNAGGREDRLTVSSDAAITPPGYLFEQLRRCVLDLHMPVEQVLPYATVNTAAVLGLSRKGRLAEGNDADLLVLTKDGLEVRHVIARGVLMVEDGTVRVMEKWMEKTKRKRNRE